MKKIILDTNFLMIPATVGVDIFAEIERICLFQYKLCIIDKTKDELKKLAEGNSKTARQAKLALDLIKLKNPTIIKTNPGHADDLILEKADKDTLVATQDLDLKKRLRFKGIGRITLRAKKYLILVEN